MPVLIITPDITAEMWLGAAGWACGSQKCSGEDAGLGAESDERQYEDQDLGRIRQPAGGLEAQRSGVGEDEPEGREDEHRAHVREDEVLVARPAVVRLLVVMDHQEERGQRHQLPAQQESDHAVGDDHQSHGDDQQAEEQVVRRRAPRPSSGSSM